VFGSAFHYWLEERPDIGRLDAAGRTARLAGGDGRLQVKLGAAYYDYGSVQGQSPDFADGLVNEFGNTVIGSGATVYAFDYDIGQLFADATFDIGGIPLNAFIDYAHNFAADNDLTDAYNVGVLVGKANAPGRWEVGLMTQAVEKDALYGHWVDSDFAGGVTDNSGQLYRVAWMPLKRVVLNVTYLDTAYNVDVGKRVRLRPLAARLQLHVLRCRCFGRKPAASELADAATAAAFTARASACAQVVRSASSSRR
jgi:hypothetical protein